jgi:hypothetical protein
MSGQVLYSFDPSRSGMDPALPQSNTAQCDNYYTSWVRTSDDVDIVSLRLLREHLDGGPLWHELCVLGEHVCRIWTVPALLWRRLEHRLLVRQEKNSLAERLFWRPWRRPRE